MHHGRRYSVGRVPIDDVAVASQLISAHGGPDGFVRIDTGFGDPELAGVLAVRTSPNSNDVVAWYRTETTSVVEWAGDPRKTPVADTDGTVQLTPRNSFDRWVEEVAGCSAPWTDVDIATAWTFQSALQAVTVRLSEQQAEADRRAHAERELEEVTANFEAFAYAASHELRRPIRKTSMRLRLLERRAR